MNITQAVATLAVAGLSVVSMSQAWAQNGLRLPHIANYFPNSQLLVDAGGGGVPGFFSPEGTQSTAKLSWMAATWRPFGDGLRTSLGMVWRDAPGKSFDLSERNVGENEWFGRPSTPFIGLGWSGAISQGSRLQLSAEFGTMVLGAGECKTSGCTTVSGLRLGSESGGMRFNPYVSFGASYRY